MSEREVRIEEIRKRLREYREHCSDPYSYFQDEIDAIRELRLNASSDIEFLLEEVDKLSSTNNYQTPA